MASLPHSLTVSFPRSASANYPVAVELGSSTISCRGKSHRAPGRVIPAGTGEKCLSR
jgi:hypothetical protein